MKARLVANSLRTEGTAKDFLLSVKGCRSRWMPVDAPTEAAELIEAYKDPGDRFEEDTSIASTDLITVLDGGLADLGIVPYYFSVDARKAGQAISIGSCVAITGDQLRRQFIVSQIDAQKGAARVKDAELNSFVVPWDLVEPWERK